MFSIHKLFRAFDHMESSELFSASPAGTPCAHTLRQYYSSGIYQSSGQYALVETSLLHATHFPGILNRDVDLYVSRKNSHYPMFFSLKFMDASLGVDALAHPWPEVLMYAFPPLCLIIPTLAKVREKGLSLILIAPRWPKAPWLAEIIPLLYAQSWCLPLRTDLLSQANGEIYHPHPYRLALWAWPVRGQT